MDKIDSKAIGGLPGWIGSQAVNETGERWMSAARTKLRLSGAGWMSEMANRSREIRVDLTGSNHNFNTGDLHTWMLQQAGGAWPGADAIWRIVVHGGVQLVSINTGNACFWFGGAIQGRVIVENHGHILGRGGQGGDGYNESLNGRVGGHAIYREGHVTLEIINYGVIGGGGGGGGGSNHSSVGDTIGAGGGAPFGAGGAAEYWGNAASYDTPGGRGAASKSGRGGYWGERGENGLNGNRLGVGGDPGYAIAGGGPLAMTVQGDIRGPVAW